LHLKIKHLVSDAAPLAAGAATKWIIATSGTTGTPKLVAHTFASLTRSLKRDFVSKPFRWALLYDPCRFAGLQVTLQALIGGSVLLAPPIDDIEACVAFLLRESCTSISATPSMWRKLLLAADAPKLDLCHITLGGEIADNIILKRLHAMFPAAKITHIYASTEAGVGFSVKDGKAGFPASYLDAVPGGRVELKVDERANLLIRGEGFEQSYVDQAQTLAGADGFVDTGDLVEIDGERVMFLGRANGSINVGGHKVMPEEIELVLRDCPTVVDVRVYGKPSTILGSVVAADVVASDEAAGIELKAQLMQLCRNRLEAFKRPAVIRIVKNIAITSAGKVKRGVE
jgi:acyl-CoA synthetase (AMP-forming)/AMP-acid ligase II